MSGHSKAPWRIVRNSEYTDDPTDTAISSIRSADDQTIVYTEDGYFKPREEDAALIASCPDLLLALRGLVREVNLSKLNVRKDFSLINAHAAATKAIRKATGTSA